MNQDRGNTDRAHREGNLAYLNLRLRSSNPYTDGPEKQDWDEGWCAAKERRPDLYLEYFADAPKNSDEEHINKSSAAYREGRRAHVVNIPRFKNPYTSDPKAAEWNTGWDDYTWRHSRWPVEEIITARGELISRFQSSFFYFAAFSLIVIGGVLIRFEWENVGFSMIMISPTLFLYPAVRFLFGGKGGLLPMAVSYILDHYIRHKVVKAIDGSNRKRR